MGYIGPNFNSPRYPQTPMTPETSQSGALPGMAQMGAGGLLPTPLDMWAAEVILSSLLTGQRTMNSQELSTLLKNLLKLPPEAVELLALLAAPEEGVGGPVSRELVQNLLNENPNISLEDLQSLMQDKTGKGGEKLLKLMQGGQGAAMPHGKEMGEMMNQLSHLSGRINQSPTEALNTTLQLYLPWVPIEGPRRMNLYFEPADEDGEAAEGAEAADAYTLVLLLETLSLGKFKIAVGVRQVVQVLVQIEHDPLATQPLGDIQTRFTTLLVEKNLPAPQVECRPRSSVLEQSSTNAQLGVSGKMGQAQSVGVHPLGGASFLVVNAAYMLARLIFETDGRSQLAQNPTVI